ncbi:hypothetical protein HMPREF5505_1842 [Lactobacillus delbrueckii subsp. lactis DSM 20072]|nr:hypothetical protein HMPREF5505_1842 [Lactobacillus delbrueckii subsp. lactis DSM 20072]
MHFFLLRQKSSCSLKETAASFATKLTITWQITWSELNPV